MTIQQTAGIDASHTDNSHSARGAFWSTLKRLAIAAGFVNFIWVLLFLWFDSTALVLLGIASVIVYWITYRLIAARQNTLALLLWWAEITVHIYVATLLLGWSGAYYLFFLLCIPAFQVSTLPRHCQTSPEEPTLPGYH